jgi:hypothetical protein
MTYETHETHETHEPTDVYGSPTASQRTVTL